MTTARDEPAPTFTPTIVAEAAAQLIAGPEMLGRRFDELQRELDALRGELAMLRRRDETLNYYMRRLDDELRLAARLQQDFLPRTLPQLGPVRFHTLFRPAGYVSGDMYDVKRLDERRVGFYITDAVGHGMPAALLTMYIKQALHTKEILADGYRLLRPSEALGRLNDAMLEQNLSHSTFATALYGIIDLDTLEFTFARAGHPHPLVLRAGGDLETTESEGGLLGIFPDEAYTDVTIKLHPGDRLLVFSDGVDVAFNDHETNASRWQTEVLLRRTLPAAQFVSELATLVEAETGGKPPKDDLTLIVVQVA